MDVAAGLLGSPLFAGGAGARWLSGLPSLLSGVSERWHLTVEDGEPVRHGAHAVVVPVRRGGERMALRLAPPEPGVVAALEAWGGDGAVRLVAADEDRGALLLERLDPARSLLDLPPVEAARVVGRLVRRLAVRPPPGLPTTSGQARAIATECRGAPDESIPGVWRDEAARCAGELARGYGEPVLVHADLTPENVLHRPGGGFVAVDPRPVAGDPERSLPEFLLRSVDGCPGEGELPEVFAAFVTAGDLDPGRARRWLVARTVQYWAWALGAGLTEDPVRCRRLLTEFAQAQPGGGPTGAPTVGP